MRYRTGRGERVSICSSTVGECRPGSLGLRHGFGFGAWDEGNGGSASAETRLVKVETKQDDQHRGSRGKASGRLGASASAFGRGEGHPFCRSGKCHHRPGRTSCVCVCVVPATRERCEGWIWICRWADSTTREPEVDQMSSSLRTEMGAPQPRSTAFLFFFVSREAGGRGRLPIGRPAVG